MKLSFIPFIIILVSIFSLGACNDKTETYIVTKKKFNDCVYAFGEIIPQDYFSIKSSRLTEILKINVHDGDNIVKGRILAVMGTTEALKYSKLNQDQLNLFEKNSLDKSEHLQELADKINVAKKKSEFDKNSAEVYRNLYLKQAVTKYEADQQFINSEISQSVFLSLKKQFEIKKRELSISLLEQQKQLINSTEVLRSPITGKIFSVNKRNGEICHPDETIITVGKPDRFKLELLVDDRDIGKVKVGQVVYFENDSYPGKSLKAEVTKIYSVLQKDTRSFKIDANVREGNLILFPGSATEANILISTIKDAILIPKKFLQKGKLLELVSDTGKEYKHVQTGREIEDWIEITSGLSFGDQIVIAAK